MNIVWKFRLFALPVIGFVVAVSILNLASEFLRPAPMALASRTSPAPTAGQISSARWAAAVAPFRSDLKADYAIALAGRTLKSEYAARAEGEDTAQKAVRNALGLGPHDSRMWLVLGLLQGRTSLGDPIIAESLKMSYLTGPSRAEVIPARLDAVTLNDTLKDSDLSELAKGDVRAMLTQLPEQRQVLASDYIRASSIGKTFLEQSARIYDPKFADSLHNAK
jgi:hypothetical protein